MFTTVVSAAVFGVQSKLVHVEADVGDGLPGFVMVGYLSSQVKEAQERVRTALKNSGFMLQPRKITVNLAPADFHKSGTAFDLPIAVAVAAAYGLFPAEVLEGTMILGELGLDGHINPVPGVLAVTADATGYGCKRCIVPCENVAEAKEAGKIEVLGVSSLSQLIRYFRGEEVLKTGQEPEAAAMRKEQEEPDFADIAGQEAAKRAALSAAAGFHNLHMIGPPGSGKSMIARRIPTIMPELSHEEAIEISRVYSVLGILDQNESLLYKRPFRSPHHSITARALSGGGITPRPGEISLAHRGVLFLDELPEFQRETLEVLRQPMENRELTITRNGYAYVFPADFMLVAAMNPCPCGYYPDLARCRCQSGVIRKYLNRISMPLLDRIDMTVEVSAITYAQLNPTEKGETSEQMRDKVKRVREIQKQRFEAEMSGPSLCGNDSQMLKGALMVNGRMTPGDVARFCVLGKEEAALMEKMFKKLKLTARGYHRILRVARTIADLEESGEIRVPHLQEALCYREINKAYW